MSYKLLSFAYLTLYYLLSHVMLFLVSFLSVIFADPVFYLSLSPLPFVLHEHFLCPDVDPHHACVFISLINISSDSNTSSSVLKLCTKTPKSTNRVHQGGLQGPTYFQRRSLKEIDVLQAATVLGQ